jgi:hypothetical protein
MSKADKMTKNTRVLILKITQRTVRVQTLSEPVKSFSFPRINFKFRLPYGNSFRLLRRQFPLRLAYAISINKAQGMEGEKMVIDGRVSPFMMGHAYVAATRVTSFKNIAILNTEEQVLDNAPTLVNVVYPELLTEHDRIINPPLYQYDISTHSFEIQERFKLCEAHVFNKLKFKQNTPSEQAIRLVVSMPLTKRKDLYKLAMGTTHSDCDHYINPRTNMESPLHNVCEPSSPHFNVLRRPTTDTPSSNIIAMEPRLSVTSPMSARRDQLEYHLNLKRFTIEDVPADGSCFFHALLLELKFHNYPNANNFTAQALRQQTCDFLQDNTALCFPDVDFSYLQLAVNPEQYPSFEDFIIFMRRSTSYAEYMVIHAAHICLEINIVVIHDIQEETTVFTNETYRTTVSLGNFENMHFVRAKPLITNTTYV